VKERASQMAAQSSRVATQSIYTQFGLPVSSRTLTGERASPQTLAILSDMVNFIPVAGTLTNVIDLAVGYNVITGEPQSRLVSGVNVGFSMFAGAAVFARVGEKAVDGTFITDYRAIGEILGPVRANTKYGVGFFSGEDTVSYYKAYKLEKSLGLESGSLNDGFRFTRVPQIGDLAPRSPLEGNQFFMGPGKGLPGGGPELVIDPIPTAPWPTGGL
jgi:hypothetical protein